MSTAIAIPTAHSPSAGAPTFADLGLPQALVDVLTEQGLHAPFAIQVSTIPDALAGRDVCGRAPTGSGKTLAFSLPTAVRAGRAEPGRPTALVLTPTRELAKQVMETIQPLAKAKKRWVAAFYGGTSVKRDLAVLRKGVDIAVATPGRLADLVQQGALSLADCRIVVLDEADRMADMGFLPEVKRLLDRTPSDRQTLLFSATLDGDIDVLVKRYQRNPARHEVDTPVEARGDVRHLFWQVDHSQRKDLTHAILARTGSTIVFTRTKHGADRLARQLQNAGINTAAIHGNRSQNQRERALGQFARGEVTALIATDVAARGIHVDGVDAVVHYDLPGSDKDYVHRSGRTGRAGARGTVVTLVLPEQRKDATSMQRGLQRELDGIEQGLREADIAVLGAPRAARPARPAPAEQRSGAPSHSARPRPNGNRKRARRR